jgi:MoxR-like ATPase
MRPKQASVLAAQILDAIERVVVGKRDSLALILTAILSGGHVLIEDLPGVGKTVIAKSFADALGLGFTRIQFTPDLLPADITGATVFDPSTGELIFRSGPLFTNLLLADEINRTPPKTQAALLEAMAESQVSIDGHTHLLPEPFVVIATDNPIEYEGTYPLPEAQLDRFTMRVRLGYLSAPDEAEMVQARLLAKEKQATITPVVTAPELLAMRAAIDDVTAEASIVEYAVRIVNATREHTAVVVGASPRGSIALVRAARACAVLARRDYVIPEDVKGIAVAVLAHRLTLRPEMWVRRIRSDDIVAELLDTVPSPPAMYA